MHSILYTEKRNINTEQNYAHIHFDLVLFIWFYCQIEMCLVASLPTTGLCAGLQVCFWWPWKWNFGEFMRCDKFWRELYFTWNEGISTLEFQLIDSIEIFLADDISNFFFKCFIVLLRFLNLIEGLCSGVIFPYWILADVRKMSKINNLRPPWSSILI